MPISFPNSPTPGDTYTTSSLTWEWTGTSWNLLPSVGSSGTSGQVASSGISTSSGTSGTSGSSGTAGTSGTSGSSGTRGSSGVSSSGTSGRSTSTSGTSGTSGVGLTITNPLDGAILTSDGSVTGSIAQSNFNFNNNTLSVTGSVIISGSLYLTGSIILKNSSSFNSSTTSNTVDIFKTNSSQVIIQKNLALLSLVADIEFSNDADAATAGIPLGGLYRSGSFILIRVV